MVDERQRQIKEGAGLEESRLNYDFIEWLRKWSTPILLVAAAISLAIFGLRKYEEWKTTRVNLAYARLDDAVRSANPSPATLIGLAEEFKSVRGIPLLARKAAAGIYHKSIMAGVDANVVLQPGEDASYLNQDGSLKDPEQRLSEEEREAYLREFESLNRQVVEATEGKPEFWVHRIAAIFNLAAAAETREDYEGARRLYEQAASEAERFDDQIHAEIARERIASLDELQNLPRLFTLAELPKPPEPELPPPGELGGEVGPPAPEATPGETQPVEPPPGEQQATPGEIPANPGEAPPPGEGDPPPSNDPPPP